MGSVFHVAVPCSVLLCEHTSVPPAFHLIMDIQAVPFGAIMDKVALTCVRGASCGQVHSLLISGKLFEVRCADHVLREG